MQSSSQNPPAISYPSQGTGKQSNGLIAASFIIGIVLLILGLAYSSFSAYIPLIINRNGLPYSLIPTLMIAAGLFFGLSGLSGLLLGIFGMRQMLQSHPPYDYFRAVAGIALCLHAALNLITLVANLVSSLLAGTVGLL